ncbi:MAG: gliding motility-associated C-terminal domain-containing protein, partial [Flavobacteriaceae bacterium]
SSSATASNTPSNISILLEEGLQPDGYDYDVAYVILDSSDGFNDVFDIQNLYDVHFNHTLKIYNRYGLCVFEGTNDKKWAGLSGDGKLVPVGTYFYVLTLNNEDNEVFTGWVYCNY